MMLLMPTKIALQVLVVPASTIAVEQIFSKRGNILDLKRSRLSPKSLEAQVCVDDWSRSEERTQDQLIQSSFSSKFLNDASTTTTSGSNDSS